MPPPGRRVGEFMRACIRTRACRMLASTRAHATPRLHWDTAQHKQTEWETGVNRARSRAQDFNPITHCQICPVSSKFSPRQSWHLQSAHTARQHKTGEIQTITFVRTFAAFLVVVEDGLKHALELSFRHQPVVIFIQPNEVFVNPCCRGGVILVRMGGRVPGQSHRVTQRGNETRKKGKGKDGLGSGGEHCERDR